jgi:N-acetylglucosamine-6-phosphate deacetylase
MSSATPDRPQLLLAAAVCTPEEEISAGYVRLAGGRIAGVGRQADLSAGDRRDTQVRELGDAILAPGFIDLHVNGGAGSDFLEASEPGDLAALRLHLAHGTTALLPTLITARHQELVEALRVLARIRASAPGPGEPRPDILGVHLEGPYLSRVKRGAHPPEPMRRPSLDEVAAYRKASDGVLRMITVAPEVEGGIPFLRAIVAQGIVAAIGHSDACYETTCAAIEAGATFAVHLFNALRSFHHREPGAVGAILDSPRVAAEIIADGVHVHPAGLRIAHRSKGTNGLVLATDAVSLAGLPDGSTGRGRLGAERIQIRNGQAVTMDGVLAGSVLTLDRAVKNMVELAGIAPREAIRMATLNPARVIGADKRKGRLAAGCDADLVVLAPDLTVREVFLSGVPVNRAGSQQPPAGSPAGRK